MSLFSDNIRYLRESRNETQQQTATMLEIKRGRYEPYESGKAEPPYDILVKVSRHFGVSVDLLLSVDIRKYEIDALLRLDDNRIVLPIKVDQNDRGLIEVVPHKARMGYATGYSDPEFIDSLQTISLPFLQNGKFRAFPGNGDSMPPHRDSSLLIGKYIESLSEVKDGNTYIVVTSTDGIVYKRLHRNHSNGFTATSDNSLFAPYELKFPEILEIWEFVCSIETEPFVKDEADFTVKDMFLELRNEIRAIRRN